MQEKLVLRGQRPLKISIFLKKMIAIWARIHRIFDSFVTEKEKKTWMKTSLRQVLDNLEIFIQIDLKSLWETPSIYFGNFNSRKTLSKCWRKLIISQSIPNTREFFSPVFFLEFQSILGSHFQY